MQLNTICTFCHESTVVRASFAALLISIGFLSFFSLLVAVMEDTKPNVAAGGDSKPEGTSDSSQINLKVRDSEGNEVQFKVRWERTCAHFCCEYFI